jgi:hypothetical protein
MKAIRRIIPRIQFELYNIPKNFGQEAEMIILPFNKKVEENKNLSYNVMKLQEKSGMVQMLNEPEEDYWNFQ